MALVTFSFTQLQAEQAPWVKHNFGDRPSWMPLLGIVEELGEWAEAPDCPTTLDIYAAEDDAIADATIFLSDYCSALGWDLETLWETRAQVQFSHHSCYPARRLLVILGRLQHSHLKMHQGIRGRREDHEVQSHDVIRSLLHALESLSGGRLLTIVEATWSRVKLRDWKADPTSGGEL